MAWISALYIMDVCPLGAQTRLMDGGTESAFCCVGVYVSTPPPQESSGDPLGCENIHGPWSVFHLHTAREH